RALSMLVNKGLDAELICVGGPVTRDDKVYVKELKNYIKEKGLNRKVKFVGPISNTESVKYFQKADVFVHSSETGSLDKVVLESMACGTPVVTSNDSAVPILSKFNSNCVFIKNDEKDLARKVAYFYGLKDDMHNLQERLREEVVTNHNIVDLINRVSSHIKE
ncbi:MAG: glycosyltransferase, partial [Candidatus Pacebacteria bacterium]|nr:glycosyltransferase [Candidatus Paceibacterota bacterium]